MHISDIRKFTRCPKMYQLSQSDKTRNFPFYNIHIDVDESVKNKLGINECYYGKPNQTNQDSLAALQQYRWLFRARFSYHYLRVKIPLLENLGENHVRMYVISLSASPNEDEAVNMKWNMEVLAKQGIIVDDIKLLYLNKEYVRNGALDDEALWIVSDAFCNSNGRPTKKIEEYVARVHIDMDAVLDEMLHFGYENEFERTNKCTGKKKCPYYEECFPFEKTVPDDSILTLVSSGKKYEMYNLGMEYLGQADLSMLEGTKQQYAQIMAARNGGLFVDKNALKLWMENNIHYPISYLDFEWDLYAVPPFDAMRPLQVLPFQYSLHVDDGNETVHKQFIGEQDCRLSFIQNLIRDLPETGSIIAYNATGAEAIRLQELMMAYPEYSEQLQDIIDRMVDLALPFTSGLIYDVRMRGLYSLKVLEGIIDQKHSYKELECGNGLEAVQIYRMLSNCNDSEQKEKYYNQLYEYCGLDSYSMIEVHHWINEVLK